MVKPNKEVAAPKTKWLPSQSSIPVMPASDCLVQVADFARVFQGKVRDEELGYLRDRYLEYAVVWHSMEDDLQAPDGIGWRCLNLAIPNNHAFRYVTLWEREILDGPG